MTRYLPGLLVLGFGCSGAPADNRPEPEPEPSGCIEVGPLPGIDFGGVAAPTGQVTAEVQVTNTCAGSLEILDVSITGTAPVGTFAVRDLDRVLLGRRGTATMHVVFHPPAGGVFQGGLSILSNDADRPESVLPLAGVGLAPRIEVSPESTSLEPGPVGCEESTPITITNTGTNDLVVHRVEAFTSSDQEFSVDLDRFNNGELSWTVPPTQSRTFYVDYLPLDASADQVFVTIGSNDPGRPEAVVDLQGSGVLAGERQLDRFEVPFGNTVDLLVVLDRELRVEGAAARLVADLPVLTSTLRATEADFHVSVVVGEEGCPVGDVPFVDSAVPQYRVRELLEDMADLEFALAPKPGTEFGGLELAASALAASKTDEGGCNGGFLRDGSSLAVLVVSDDPDQSPLSWSAYVSQLQARVEDPYRVSVHALAGDYPDGCGGEDGAKAGTGYYEASAATGGIFSSVCAVDYRSVLRSVAERSDRGWGGYRLTDQPIPQTLEVLVDGRRWTDGWEYDVSSGSIVFVDEDRQPPRGSAVEVSYQPLPDCH